MRPTVAFLHNPLTLDFDPSTQDYGIPDWANPNILYDTTDKGHLWDSNQNKYQFWYSVEDGFVAAPGTDVPVNWLYFEGYWGDEAVSRQPLKGLEIGRPLKLTFGDSASPNPLPMASERVVNTVSVANASIQADLRDLSLGQYMNMTDVF